MQHAVSTAAGSRAIVARHGPKPRVLFIHPQGNNWLPGEQDLTRFANIMPPVGVCSIAAFLETRGLTTAIIDAYALPRTTAEIVARAVAFAPDVVGFSVTTSSFPDANDIATALRGARPDVPFVFGGVHVSALREELLRRFPVIDYGVVGEGEQTMTELLEGGFAEPASVRGLVYREGALVRASAPRTDLLELDSLPFPAYERLEGFPGAYHLAIFNYGKAPGTSTVTSRGCPYSCSYCDRSVYQRSFRANSATYIYEHMRYLKERFGMRHVTFYDDLFSYDRKRIVEFCELLIAKPLRMTFACDVRVNHIDEELVRLLARAGCYQVAFGIESGDPEVLKRHRRDPRLDGVREVARVIRKAGIRTKGLFMMGLPGEDEPAIRRSLELALSLPLDEVNLAKFTPFPGAPLYAGIHEQGELTEDWRLMNCMNFVFVPKGLTRERLEELYSEFIIRFFNQPRVWWGYIMMVWRSPASVLTFFRHAPSFIAFGLGMWARTLWSRWRKKPVQGREPPALPSGEK